MKQNSKTAGSIVFMLLAAPVLAKAQDNQTMILDRITSDEMLRSIVILTLVYFVSHFILSLIRLYLNHRLKIKIVEAGLPEQSIEKLLQSGINEKKIALKYFCILTGFAVGFILINLTRPAPLAGMTGLIFSVALSFLAYFLLIRKGSEL